MIASSQFQSVSEDDIVNEEKSSSHFLPDEW